MGRLGFKHTSTSSSGDASTLQVSRDGPPQSSNATSTPSPPLRGAEPTSPSRSPRAGRAPQVPAPSPSARCRRRPALRGSPGRGHLAGDDRAEAAARTPAHRALGTPRPALALPSAGRATTTRARPGGRPRPAGARWAGDEGEGGCPAPPRPPSILPALGRGSVRLPDRLTGLPPASPPGSPAFRPPCGRCCRRPTGPAAAAARARSASSRAPPASPHPREWPGGSQLAAGPPPPLPAATNGPPPPGGRARPLAVEDRAARAGRRAALDRGGRRPLPGPSPGRAAQSGPATWERGRRCGRGVGRPRPLAHQPAGSLPSGRSV